MIKLIGKSLTFNNKNNKILKKIYCATNKENLFDLIKIIAKNLCLLL